jgi:hypothetical protein
VRLCDMNPGVKNRQGHSTTSYMISSFVQAFLVYKTSRR